MSSIATSEVRASDLRVDDQAAVSSPAHPPPLAIFASALTTSRNGQSHPTLRNRASSPLRCIRTGTAIPRSGPAVLARARQFAARSQTRPVPEDPLPTLPAATRCHAPPGGSTLGTLQNGFSPPRAIPNNLCTEQKRIRCAVVRSPPRAGCSSGVASLQLAGGSAP
jgi:hypothetical protein